MAHCANPVNSEEQFVVRLQCLLRQINLKTLNNNVNIKISIYKPHHEKICLQRF